MTNEDAIERLRKIADRIWLSPLEHKAVNMAIKALEAQMSRKESNETD